MASLRYDPRIQYGYTPNRTYLCHLQRSPFKWQVGFITSWFSITLTQCSKMLDHFIILIHHDNNTHAHSHINKVVVINTIIRPFFLLVFIRYNSLQWHTNQENVVKGLTTIILHHVPFKDITSFQWQWIPRDSRRIQRWRFVDRFPGGKFHHRQWPLNAYHIFNKQVA